MQDEDKFIDEEPREIDRYPLLKRIYKWHDDLISQYTEKPCLDVGFGKEPFKEADYGVEPEPANIEAVPDSFNAEIASGHDMPYEDNFFESVVAKRV
ncbi:MAG: hypothetical protein SVV03_01415, partial [Candidatus Nanohaloarchaea archaeon]|nr:hypothetical protein [Candidatus Nanohaloarchaea archaeon]